IESFRRALQINPSAIFAHAHIGRLLTRLGHPREGIEEIRQYVRLGGSDPSLGYAYLFLAEAELALGNRQTAFAWTLKAEAFYPGSPRFEAWIAALYAMSGDKDNAARHAEQFRL